MVAASCPEAWVEIVLDAAHPLCVSLAMATAMAGSCASAGGGRTAAYARGFGGQYVIVVPSLAMTVVVTSDTDTRLRVDGYGDALWSMIENHLIPAALPTEG